ncbi:MAG: ATP-dependent DNA helicase RecG [Candidatus Buchananbacteria bacterium]|nr:ATP-dependent DNA helicase RecG [Candidatus Buchananbacteria bacterium]
MKLTLTTPVSQITRVGKTTADRLKRLEIETVNDLIFYYPWRWEDLSKISKISELKTGELSTIKVKIQLLSSRRSLAKRKILTEGLVADESGSLKIVWFNQPFLAKTLQIGDEVYFSGKVDFGRYGFQMTNPVYEKVTNGSTTHTARIVPIYPLTHSLTAKQIRFLIKSALVAVDQVVDFLPPEIITSYRLMSLSEALRQIHFPDNQQLLDQAIRRLKFNELFLFELRVMINRSEIRQETAEVVLFKEQETKDFISQLPFSLTNDQRKAAWQIISDLQQSRPMNRLLEGDVGSGKTLVALLAMLNVARNEKQSVLMSPTEILASQHYQTISKLFSNSNIKTGLLTRSQKLINNEKVSQSKMLSGINSGEVKIIVGTHALIQESVKFNSLALAVIDEQHRFGVTQRKHLRENSGNSATTPHLLSMTATPIPRSLALALYGDLDLSIIREMPKERKKIITKLVEGSKRNEAYEFIRQQIDQGRQAFIICPLIDPSDTLGVRSVTEEYERLSGTVFSDLTISMLHGKLKSMDKERIMADFLANKSKILVATSVVEVGVDVPNASVMLIEGADRFGLAQLHQFRGRVGRSSYQSYCFLVSEQNSQKTAARLRAMVSAKDGFELAELDLELRGPGEVYGTTQSGFPEFKLATLTDYRLIQEAKIAAEGIVKKDNRLDGYPDLKYKLKDFLALVHPE